MTKRTKILTWAGCIALIVGTGIGGVAFSTTVIKAKKPAPGKTKFDQMAIQYDGTGPDGQKSTGNTWKAISGKDGESWGNFHAQIYPETLPQECKFEVISDDISSNYLHFQQDSDGKFRVHWSASTPAGDYTFKVRSIWSFDESQYETTDTPFTLSLLPKDQPETLTIGASQTDFSVTSDQSNNNVLTISKTVAPATAVATGTVFTGTCDMGDDGIKINSTTGVVSYSKLSLGEHHFTIQGSLKTDSGTIYSNRIVLNFKVSKPLASNITIDYAGSTGDHPSTLVWQCIAGEAGSSYGEFSAIISPSEADPELNWHISNSNCPWLRFNDQTMKIEWDNTSLVGEYSFKVWAESKDDPEHPVKSNEKNFTAHFNRPEPTSIAIDTTGCVFSGVENQPGNSLNGIYSTVSPTTALQDVKYTLSNFGTPGDDAKIYFSQDDKLIKWNNLAAGDHTFDIVCTSTINTSISATKSITLEVTSPEVAKRVSISYPDGSTTQNITKKTPTGKFPTAFQADVYPSSADQAVTWSLNMADGSAVPSWLHIDENGFVYWDSLPAEGEYTFFVKAVCKSYPTVTDTYNNAIKIVCNLSYAIGSAEEKFNEETDSIWYLNKISRNPNDWYKSYYVMKDLTFDFPDPLPTDFKYSASFSANGKWYTFSNITSQGYENYDPLPSCFKLNFVKDSDNNYSLYFEIQQGEFFAFTNVSDKYSELKQFCTSLGRIDTHAIINATIDNSESPLNWITKKGTKDRFDFDYTFTLTMA